MLLKDLRPARTVAVVRKRDAHISEPSVDLFVELKAVGIGCGNHSFAVERSRPPEPNGSVEAVRIRKRVMGRGKRGAADRNVCAVKDRSVRKVIVCRAGNKIE